MNERQPTTRIRFLNVINEEKMNHEYLVKLLLYRGGPARSANINIDSLPSEIHRHILSYGDEDVRAVAATSKTFKREVDTFDIKQPCKNRIQSFETFWLQYTPYRKHMNLEGCIANDLQIGAVITWIYNSKNLESLNLSNNKITPEGIKGIADALRVNGVLANLDLSYNDLCGLAWDGEGTYDANGITALAEALKVNRALTSLDVGANDLKKEATLAIVKAAKLRKMTSLGLAASGITQYEAAEIAEYVKDSGTLTKLNLSSNVLGAEGGKAIAEALKVNAVLTNLDVQYNEISTEGAKAFAEALRVNAVLTTLNIDGNGIGNEGAKAFANALTVSRVLTTLNININHIGSEGAMAIAEMLKVNGVLTTLDVSRNQLDAEAGRALADALSVNGVLTSLYLSGNELCGLNPYTGEGTYDATGITALANALKVNTALTNLELDRNWIGPEGGKAIAEALKANSVLKTLNILYNPLGVEGVNALREAVEGRKGFNLMI